MSIRELRSLASGIATLLLFTGIETAAQPALLWRTNYSGLGQYSASFCGVDALGNIYSRGGTGYTNLVIVKYSPSGSLIWTFQYAGPQGKADFNGAAIDSAGDLYVAGTTTSALGAKEIVVLKLQGNGVPAWTNNVGTGTNDFSPVALGLDDAGNVHVGGSGYNTSNRDILLLKFNSSGAITAQTYFDGPQHGSDELLAMTVDPKTGATYATLKLFDSNNNLARVFAKFDATGTLEWMRNSGETNATGLYGDCFVLLSGDAGIYFADAMQKGPMVWKFNSEGTLVWKTAYDGPAQRVNGCVVDLFGNVTMVINLETVGEILVHFDRMGVQRWTALLRGSYPVLAVDFDSVFVRTCHNYYLNLTRYDPNGSQRWSQTTPATNQYSGGLVATNGYCIATDSGTGPTGTWDLFVAKYTTNAGAYGPMILSASSGVSGAPGDTVELFVNALGTGPLKYEWVNSYAIKDAVNPYLRFTLNKETAGTYFVTVADSIGITTSAAMPVTIRPNPMSDQTAVLNGTATFTLRFNGPTPEAVQWLFNGATLANETNLQLKLTNIALAAAGTYTAQCRSDSNVTSVSARLFVSEQVAMEWQRSAGSQASSLGITDDRLGHIAMVHNDSWWSHYVSIFDSDGALINTVTNTWIGSTYGNPSRIVANALGVLAYCAVKEMSTYSIRVAQYGPLATNWITGGNVWASVWNVCQQLLVDDAGNIYLLVSGIGYNWEKPRSEAIKLIRLSAAGTTDLLTIQEIAYGVRAFDMTFVSSNELALVWCHRGTNLITRMRRDGTVVWSREMPFPASNIVADHQGNLLVIGTVVAKYSPNGDLLWMRTRPAQQFRHAAAVDQADNAVVQFSSHTTKFDSEGERVWDAPISGSIQIDERNNAYVSGTVLKSDGTSDLFVAKLDTNGVMLWRAVYNGEQDTNEINGGIVVGSDGVVYLCAGDGEARLVKFVERHSTRAPIIAPSPQVRLVEAGTSATLSPTVTGSGLAYQWLLDGAALPGSTNQTLTLTNFQPSQAGGYSLNVQNSFGWVMGTETFVTTPPTLFGVAYDKPSNRRSFSFLADARFVYDVQSSADLVSWTPETSFAGTNGSVLFSATNNVSSAFYRVWINR